jgi:hypothetical protein
MTGAKPHLAAVRVRGHRRPLVHLHQGDAEVLGRAEHLGVDDREVWLEGKAAENVDGRACVVLYMCVCVCVRVRVCVFGLTRCGGLKWVYCNGTVISSACACSWTIHLLPCTYVF